MELITDVVILESVSNIICEGALNTPSKRCVLGIDINCVFDIMNIVSKLGHVVPIFNTYTPSHTKELSFLLLR